MASGKRAGVKQKATLRPVLLALALGVTVTMVAWGYLVFAAIDFGASARNGETVSWWFLALSSLGAVACLFVALILCARIARSLGITQAPPPPPTHDPHAPPGGKRAAR